jgi:hypothetical protein
VTVVSRDEVEGRGSAVKEGNLFMELAQNFLFGARAVGREYCKVGRLEDQASWRRE